MTCADASRGFGLERVVRWCGWVDEPGPWVAGASVQACPSRDAGFSQTAVLAMGLGVPVVGTDVDGFPDTLAERRGIIVAPEDPQALARALEDVLSGRRQPDVAAAPVGPAVRSRAGRDGLRAQLRRALARGGPVTVGWHAEDLHPWPMLRPLLDHGGYLPLTPTLLRGLWIALAKRRACCSEQPAHAAHLEGSDSMG